MKEKNIYIAIADDHAVMRKGIIASMKPYRRFRFILEAGNGQELIEKLAVARQLPDICILDICMQPVNGYETANTIKQRWPSVKTVALSMFDEEFSIINMIRNGAMAYLTKSCELEKLAIVLEQVHEKGFYHDDIDAELLNKIIHGAEVYSPFTDKEIEFLYLCCSDHNYEKIGERMNVSRRTVENYRDSLFKKLNIKTRTGLATFAMLTGYGPHKVAV